MVEVPFAPVLISRKECLLLSTWAFEDEVCEGWRKLAPLGWLSPSLIVDEAEVNFR